MRTLIVGEIGDACTNLVRPGRNPADRGVEMEIHPFAGGSEIALLCMVHALELMDTLLVPSEHLRRYNEPLPFHDFALPRDVRFGCNRRAVMRPDVFLRKSEPLPQRIDRLVECQQVLRHVHVIGDINPVGPYVPAQYFDSVHTDRRPQSVASSATSLNQSSASGFARASVF